MAEGRLAAGLLVEFRIIPPSGIDRIVLRLVVFPKVRVVHVVKRRDGRVVDGMVEVAGTIDAAAAYSISPHIKNSKITIGDSLTLQFSVRWYPGTTLPPGWSGYGGHLYKSTFLYCLLSA